MTRSLRVVCIGQVAFVLRLPVHDLLQNGMAELGPGQRRLRFTTRHLAHRIDEGWAVWGPFPEAGYLVGSKVRVPFRSVASLDEIPGVGEVEGGRLIIGGGAVNNSRLLESLLPEASIDLHVGGGPAGSVLRPTSNILRSGKVNIYPTWQEAPFYLEIDLAPLKPEHLVLKPALALVPLGTAPKPGPCALAVVNSIYHPSLLATAADVLRNSELGIIAVTEPLLSNDEVTPDDLAPQGSASPPEPVPFAEYTLRNLLPSAQVAILNRDEALLLCSRADPRPPENLGDLARSLQSTMRCAGHLRCVFVTLGQFGAFLLQANGSWHFAYVHPDFFAGGRVHTYGLGDAFAAGVAAEEAQAHARCGPSVGVRSLIAGVACATCALTHGYAGVEIRRVHRLLRTHQLRTFSVNGRASPSVRRLLTTPLRELAWRLLFGIRAHTCDKVLSTPLLSQ